MPATLASGNNIQINITGSGGTNVYLDDIRIHPYNCATQTHVYLPDRLWLVASLDDRSFATFYNYDEEGNLVQVKKETERGIVTLQTSRQNIKQITPQP